MFYFYIKENKHSINTRGFCHAVLSAFYLEHGGDLRIKSHRTLFEFEIRQQLCALFFFFLYKALEYLKQAGSDILNL